jgi:A/G-specific adenine glycosylase
VTLQKRTFQRALIDWYSKNGRRDLPWRQTRNPYAILVSELMLQQTQVATVLPYYHEWLRRFPNIASLARVPEAKVLHTWQGLGYYSRARNLHAAAKIIQSQYKGKIPHDPARIRQLPGIGRYIANAVATFAFDQSLPIVEANTARVLARLFNVRKPIDSAVGREQLWRHAGELVPQRNARRFNSALMDLGALVCLPRKPQCGVCPVKNFCQARSPEDLPIKRPRPRTKRITEDHVLLARNGRILLEQSTSRWRGMWTLPRLELDGLKPSSFSRPIHTSYFPFTHHRVRLRVFSSRTAKPRRPHERWVRLRKIDSIPIPSPHRRAISTLLSLNVGR